MAATPVAVEQALTLKWPLHPGSIATGRAEVICLGPTDWLILAPSERDSRTLFTTVCVAFRESSFRATDLSSAMVQIRLEGNGVRSLLAQGCSIDLHRGSFPPGLSVRTRFAGMPLVVRCRELATFDLIVASSHREHLVGWLANALAHT
jgi:sarcosine oxidase subunit gamma